MRQATRSVARHKQPLLPREGLMAAFAAEETLTHVAARKQLVDEVPWEGPQLL